MNKRTESTASNLVALSLGAWLTACSGAETNEMSETVYEDTPQDPTSMEVFGSVEDEVTACDDHQYDHWRYLSALAVASATELGRWHPADFAPNMSNGTVQLSATGLARCASGCPNIQAILQMQDNATSIVPRHDPQLLRGLLWSFLDRQKNFNLSNPVPNHSLTLSRVTDDVCGSRYHFRVGGGGTSTSSYGGTTELKASHSNRCVDIAAASVSDGGRVLQYDCWGGGNQEFSVEAVGNGHYRLRNVLSGKCIGVTATSTSNGATLEQRSCGANDSQSFFLNHKGSSKFELKNVKSGKCVDVANASASNMAAMQLYDCWGGANQTFHAPGVVSNASSPGTSPSNLYNQLKLFGQAENRYLMFASTATEVSIDPMGTLIDGGSSAISGACYEGSTVYSGSHVSGACCIVSGKYGKLQKSPWNAKMYFCK